MAKNEQNKDWALVELGLETMGSMAKNEQDKDWGPVELGLGTETRN